MRSKRRTIRNGQRPTSPTGGTRFPAGPNLVGDDRVPGVLRPWRKSPLWPGGWRDSRIPQPSGTSSPRRGVGGRPGGGLPSPLPAIPIVGVPRRNRSFGMARRGSVRCRMPSRRSVPVRPPTVVPTVPLARAVTWSGRTCCRLGGPGRGGISRSLRGGSGSAVRSSAIRAGSTGPTADGPFPGADADPDNVPRSSPTGPVPRRRFCPCNHPVGRRTLCPAIRRGRAKGSFGLPTGRNSTTKGST